MATTAEVSVTANKETKEFTLTEEEFLKASEAVKTQFEAQKLLNKVYSLSSESFTKSFKTPIEMTWPVFYRIYELENKFGITNHFASAYGLMNVCEPVLNNLWFTKTRVPEQRWASQEDFLSSCFMYVSELLELTVDEKGKEHGYNPEKNDNILPWAISTFTSCVNSVVAPDISLYLQKTYAYSSVSLDEPCDNEDHKLQVKDVSCCVEEFIMAKIKSEATGRAVLDILLEDAPTSRKIEELTTLKKLGLTLDDAEIGMITDIYEDIKSREGAKVTESEEEAEEEREAI